MSRHKSRPRRNLRQLGDGVALALRAVSAPPFGEADAIHRARRRRARVYCASLLDAGPAHQPPAWETRPRDRLSRTRALDVAHLREPRPTRLHAYASRSRPAISPKRSITSATFAKVDDNPKPRRTGRSLVTQHATGLTDAERRATCRRGQKPRGRPLLAGFAAQDGQTADGWLAENSTCPRETSSRLCSSHRPIAMRATRRDKALRQRAVPSRRRGQTAHERAATYYELFLDPDRPSWPS
jgi:hypothetical protein